MGSAQRRLKNLYFGLQAAERKSEILQAVETGKPLSSLYLITFAENGIDQLDIFPSYVLAQHSVKRRIPLLVGAAFGREEAIELVGSMASDAYRETGECHLQSFLLERDGCKEEVTV